MFYYRIELSDSDRSQPVMTIEISQPKLQSLIQQRMASGRYKNVEDVLLKAFETAPLAAELPGTQDRRTGADLIAAMQAMPYPEVDIEPSRSHMPVRDVTL